jgi:hypothetical protein
LIDRNNHIGEFLVLYKQALQEEEKEVDQDLDLLFGLLGTRQQSYEQHPPSQKELKSFLE